MSRLRGIINDEIQQFGPLPFSRFVELALYHPELGFYQGAGRAGGRQGDFITSVETGPLFAAVIGDWLDDCWRAAGEPSEFVVAEAGAGVGTLYRGLVKATPACFDALRWLLVEQSATQREAHSELPPGRWESLAELPGRPVDLVVANELLDNLPFNIVERVGDRWHPCLVTDIGDRLEFTIDDTHEPVARRIEAPTGTRLPVPVGAHEWLVTACRIADHVVALDYAATIGQLIERGVDGWLRAYAGHTLVTDVLAEPGTADITHDVPIGLLPAPDVVTSQAEWLEANGIGARVDRARATWAERAHIGDLEALFARSAIGEAESLLDPDGLGGFTVMEWRR